MSDFQSYLEGLPEGTEFTIPRTDTTRAVWGTWIKRDVAGMTFFESTEGRQEGAMQAGSYFALTYEEPVRAALTHAEQDRMQRGGNFIEEL
jgi:hypothetical protein